MDTLTTFPDAYPRINQWVAAILFPFRWEQPGGNVDFFVHLNDGRAYAFLAITPDNLLYLMDRDQMKEFLSPGMVVVRKITGECILAAVEHWLQYVHDDSLGLAHFGCLQRHDEEATLPL